MTTGQGHEFIRDLDPVANAALRYLACTVNIGSAWTVLNNFTGVSAEQLLERMIELSLYAEDKLKGG